MWQRPTAMRLVMWCPAPYRLLMDDRPGGFIAPIEVVPPEFRAEHQELYEAARERYERGHGPEDGGPESGVREPRRPKPPTPTRAAERG
jgi:hypothetical protein